MGEDAKPVRQELAELTEAVRELRDREVADEIKALRGEIERLRAEKAPHTCCGHSCVHWHYWPSVTYPATYTLPNTVICGSGYASVASGAYGGGGSWTNVIT